MSRTWLAWGIGMASALGGCGTIEKPPVVLGRAVLKEWPKVPWGEAIDPGSVLVSIDAAGNTYLEGRLQTPGEMLPLLKKPQKVLGISTDPVLLEVHPTLSYRDLQVLFENLIGTACRVNLAFLVSTPDGPRGLVLSVACHSCVGSLQYYDGHNEHKVEGASLWIDVRPGHGGSIQVVELRWSDYDELLYFFPSDDEKVSQSAKGQFVWKGDLPPLGPWTLESRVEVMADPQNGDRGAFVNMKVEEKDKMSDVLTCLSNIKKMVGPRIVTELPARWEYKTR